MSRQPVNRPSGNPFLPLILVAGLAAVALSVWGAVSLGREINGEPFIGNPMELVISLFAGKVAWPGLWSTAFLVVEVLLLVGLAVLVGLLVRRRTKGRTRVDKQARSLAHVRDLHQYTPAGVAESAARLRPGGAGDDPSGHGGLVGRVVPSGVEFRSSLEDTEVDIWGPRTGKSTSRAIPLATTAPGAVVLTSNKRDVHDATRGVREEVGSIWLFDPQQIVGGEQEFWFPILDTVTGPTQAATLVSHFVAGTRPAGAKTDAYFDGEGENLMGYYFLAAARSGQPITAAYKWAANSRDRAPLTILKDHGDKLIAAKLQSLIEAPDKQREGVYASALKLLRCLEDPQVTRWVVPPRSSSIPAFDAKAFLHTRDTLYLLSKEGEGSASPLVAALTFAVLEAGERIAQNKPAARLDPPLYCILDEAANVCRIRELPNLYSHFGSRGMLVITILQSWEQGVEVWGRSGMQKLWDTANVRVYGGGVADADFLDRLSRLIGEHDQLVYSESRDRSGNTSRSTSIRRQRIYDVSDLASLPRGRAVVIASGVPATLIEPVPWMVGPYADKIRASLAKYDPGARAAVPIGGTPDPFPVDPPLDDPAGSRWSWRGGGRG